MRASRLLSVLLLLQNRGRMTAREIADELEVSVRTVYRDLESLAAAGVPVVADRGAAGGYRLLAGYRTRLTGLTADEADALFLAGLPAAAAELGLGSVLATTERKLLAALPEPVRERAVRVRERFHVDVPGWFRAAEEVPLLGEVAAAVWEQRRIRVTYLRWRQPRQVVRLLEPLGLVLKSGTWYLVAAAADPSAAEAAATGPDADGRAAPRVYRISKILSLETTDATFSRPDGFDLAAYWSAWAARYEAELYRGRACVRLSPAGMAMASLRLPPAVARAVRETAGPPEPDGWVRARIPIESVRHAQGELLALGPDVEVLEPPELREAMARAAQALAALYGGSGAPPGDPSGAAAGQASAAMTSLNASRVGVRAKSVNQT